MGDRNQYWFVSKYKDVLEGPFLEVGSKNYGTTSDFRSVFSRKGKYVGVDTIDGNGVDVVLDLTIDFQEIVRKLGSERFKPIICLSVLEHCEQPFQMAENLTKLLHKEGKIIVSVPFAWRFHGYPSDDWRFTHEGVKNCFQKLISISCKDSLRPQHISI